MEMAAIQGRMAGSKVLPLFIKRGFEAASGTSRALLHGLAGGLGGAVNLASHGFHVFSYSADRIAGGESKGCGERQKGGFDIHYLKRG